MIPKFRTREAELPSPPGKKVVRDTTDKILDSEGGCGLAPRLTVSVSSPAIVMPRKGVVCNRTLFQPNILAKEVQLNILKFRPLLVGIRSKMQNVRIQFSYGYFSKPYIFFG